MTTNTSTEEQAPRKKGQPQVIINLAVGAKSGDINADWAVQYRADHHVAMFIEYMANLPGPQRESINWLASIDGKDLVMHDEQRGEGVIVPCWEWIKMPPLTHAGEICRLFGDYFDLVEYKLYAEEVWQPHAFKYGMEAVTAAAERWLNRVPLMIRAQNRNNPYTIDKAEVDDWFRNGTHKHVMLVATRKRISDMGIQLLDDFGLEREALPDKYQHKKTPVQPREFNQ